MNEIINSQFGHIVVNKLRLIIVVDPSLSVISLLFVESKVNCLLISLISIQKFKLMLSKI